MADRCPTCGAPVRVESSDEGTSHYVPVGDRVDVLATWLEAIPEETAREAAIALRSLREERDARDKAIEKVMDTVVRFTEDKDERLRAVCQHVEHTLIPVMPAPSPEGREGDAT